MKRLALAVCVFRVALGTASAQTTVTMLDTGADVGAGPALAVGSDGLGLVAYYDATNGNLKVAKCANTACTNATVSTLDSAGDVGRQAAAAIGTDGRGVIAYYDATLPAVKIAHCNDATCTSAAVSIVDGSVVFGRIGVAIGSDGLPLVAYIGSGSTLRAAHCSNAGCSASTVTTLGFASANTSVVIGADGLALIASQVYNHTLPAMKHCQDVACTAATPVPARASSEGMEPIVTIVATPTGMALPADGRVLIANWFYQSTLFPVPEGAGPISQMRMSRCADVACSSQSLPVVVNGATLPPDVAVQPNGFGWFAHLDLPGRLHLRACTDAACASQTETCASIDAAELSLERAGDGLGIAHDVADSCPLPELRLADTFVAEGSVARFTATMSPASTTPQTVSFGTSDGTAVAGQDYVATSGTLTFLPGATSAVIEVPTLTDALPEPDEAFALDLSSPSGATIGDGRAVATIADVPSVSTGPCQVIEGDLGTRNCVLLVSLSQPSTQWVLVSYATMAGSAGLGDYFDVSGTLTFDPGVLHRAVSVPVLGDTAVELDETFFLILSSPFNVTIADGVGEGTIEDDDAPSLSSLELTHGSSVVADLAADPGPTANADLYRLGQGPYSSWEIVADGVSGDVAIQLERLGEDNVTVVQTAVSVGTGAAQALRWQRRSAVPESREHIRVRSVSCTTECGADDTYRLRVYETTGVIPRFNNFGSQVTVLILQNTTSQPVTGTADFWDTSGTLLASQAFALGPKAVGLFGTSSIAGLNGTSGSVTITHDAPYGGLTGKTVALEPTSGFSFDSPMLAKMR
jgi:hypothetical protein